MRTDVDDVLRREAERYGFRFTCEHCVYYDEATRSCAEGYPAEEHVDASLEHRTRLYFCKSFELW